MSTALEEATDALRTRVLRGVFSPDTKLGEMAVAETLGVSRTIARLAMSTLEHEGLLQREAKRGSRVRRFMVNEIADAIEVRGELEAMAVLKAAERGLSARIDDALYQTLEKSEALLGKGVLTDASRKEWAQNNKAFHDLVVEAAGNWALKMSIEHMSRLPLVSPSAIVFDLNDPDIGNRQLAMAHADHVAIFHAMRDRQGQRAGALMREHAFRNAANKRANLANAASMELARRLPGGPMIAPSD